MASDNKLELVGEVDVNKANASIESVSSRDICARGSAICATSWAS